jgi:hypothetical protein
VQPARDINDDRAPVDGGGLNTLPAAPLPAAALASSTQAAATAATAAAMAVLYSLRHELAALQAVGSAVPVPSGEVEAAVAPSSLTAAEARDELAALRAELSRLHAAELLAIVPAQLAASATAAADAAGVAAAAAEAASVVCVKGAGGGDEAVATLKQLETLGRELHMLRLAPPAPLWHGEAEAASEVCVEDAAAGRGADTTLELELGDCEGDAPGDSSICACEGDALCACEGDALGACAGAELPPSREEAEAAGAERGEEVQAEVVMEAMFEELGLDALMRVLAPAAVSAASSALAWDGDEEEGQETQTTSLVRLAPPRCSPHDHHHSAHCPWPSPLRTKRRRR